MNNSDCQWDRTRDHLGDTSLSMSLSKFPDWVKRGGKIPSEHGDVSAWAGNPEKKKEMSWTFISLCFLTLNTTWLDAFTTVPSLPWWASNCEPASAISSLGWFCQEFFVTAMRKEINTSVSSKWTWKLLSLQGAWRWVQACPLLIKAWRWVWPRPLLTNALERYCPREGIRGRK